MGSADDEPMADDDEKPAHQVTVSEFWIGKYPITNEQYQRVRPEHAKGEAGELPVTHVSWNDARAFCEQLGYRLPTEAEWEYAARAGTRTPWSFGDDESEIGRFAWFRGNSENRVHPVGTREPNPWGLYDMHGNVWEWVDDEYGSYSPEPQTDPATPSASRSLSVGRGGSFRDASRVLRSAFLCWVAPGFRFRFLGFLRVRGPRRQP
ncbi:MAG: formylglycine-generating enzyme family protein, partial [bacterium]|nr:formylglycine-generating enzyme family protein [bacterium]